MEQLDAGCMKHFPSRWFFGALLENVWYIFHQLGQKNFFHLLPHVTFCALNLRTREPIYGSYSVFLPSHLWGSASELKIK